MGRSLKLQRSLAGWKLACIALVAAAVMAPFLGSLTRPVFILACLAVGYLSWRRDPTDHLQAVLLLFAFAPLVRRLVDLHAGYDFSGLMLSGPLIALLPPAASLLKGLESRSNLSINVGPMLIVGACVTYAVTISLVQDDIAGGASNALKWLAPVIYGIVLSLARMPGNCCARRRRVRLHHSGDGAVRITSTSIRRPGIDTG